MTDYIRSMGADMGGTNILSALVAVLEGRHQPADSSSYLYLLKQQPPMLPAAADSSTLPPLPPPTCPRQLFILSDGMMDNKREDILDILRKHSTNTTAFTFGIGGAHPLPPPSKRAKLTIRITSKARLMWSASRQWREPCAARPSSYLISA